MLAKIRNGKPKIQVWRVNCKFFVKIRQNVGNFFWGGEKVFFGKCSLFTFLGWRGILGGEYPSGRDASGWLDAGRRDAMHRVSTDGAGT